MGSGWFRASLTKGNRYENVRGTWHRRRGGNYGVRHAGIVTETAAGGTTGREVQYGVLPHDDGRQPGWTKHYEHDGYDEADGHEARNDGSDAVVDVRTGVFVDSPGALQVQKDKLQLSQEQTGQLGEIEKEARQRALALLTPQQRTALGDIPEKPLVMMEMCQQMRTKMSAEAGGNK